MQRAGSRTRAGGGLTDGRAGATSALPGVVVTVARVLGERRPGGAPPALSVVLVTVARVGGEPRPDGLARSVRPRRSERGSHTARSRTCASANPGPSVYGTARSLQRIEPEREASLVDLVLARRDLGEHAAAAIAGPPVHPLQHALCAPQVIGLAHARRLGELRDLRRVAEQQLGLQRG